MAVFLSHVSTQHQIAEQLARELEARGTKTWYAPRDIPPGTVWDEQISQAIRECDHFLLLFSARADRSPHVKRELALADKYRKPIYWVRSDSAEPELLAYFLADTQWVDWDRDATSVADSLVATMAGEVTRNQQIQRKASRRTALTAAGVAAVAAAGGGVWLATRPAAPTSAPQVLTKQTPETPSPAPSGPPAVDHEIALKVSPSDVVVGGDLVYVTGRKSGQIIKVDIATGLIAKSPPIRVNHTVYGAAFDNATGYLYVADFDDNTLLVYDGVTNARIHKVPRIGHGAPFRVAVDPDNHRAYVACSGEHVDTVSVVDTSTFKKLAPLSVGHNPAGMAVDPHTHDVVVTSRNDDIVSLVNPDSGKRRDVRVGKHPFRCAIDSRTSLAYVANASDNVISVVDLATAKVVHTMAVGTHPCGVAIDEAEGIAYVSNAGIRNQGRAQEEGTVVTVSLSTWKVVDTFPVEKGPTGVAVNKNGTVYVASQPYDKKSVGTLTVIRRS